MKQSESQGRAYPQYAMRVWFLNGRYSAGARQGDIARSVRRTAESVQAQPSTSGFPIATWLPIVRTLWEMGEDEAELRPAWSRHLTSWWRGATSKLPGFKVKLP